MWSPEAYYQIMQHTQGKLADCQNLIDEAMTSTLFSHRPTSRLYELVGLIRGCFERQKRFIIVADRLYLVTMAVAVCNKMGLKVGVLAGSNIFGSKTTTRDEAVSELNVGSLDGMVITPGVGGTGLNMIGACVMIFMGSAYSISSERQCVCRMCRERQTAKCVYAVIIADRKFKGDQAAFDIKDERAKEDGEMTRLFHVDDFPVFEKINLYQRPAAEFQKQIYQEQRAHVDRLIAEHKQQEEQRQKE